MNKLNNASLPFDKMPKEYLNLKEGINNKILKFLYSKFNFEYFIQKEDTNSKSLFHDYLQTINFMVFKRCLNDSNSKLIILCFEGHCLLVENIDEELFKRFIEDNNSVFIDLDSEKDDSDVKKEIFSFISKFENDIKSNMLLKQTIEPISAYIIRRNFYPSKLFKDKSFFSYEQNQNETEENDFLEFNSQKMLKKVENDQKENENHVNEKEYFQENDFIQLRQLNNNDSSTFFLVIHLKNFYIFLNKKIGGSDLFLKEKDFVNNYSNQYLTRFYGFVKNQDKITGLIYEYMSNGSLEQYFSKNKENINEFFSYLTMLRIAQGIKYLHSNSLIHRDIKPSNILVDHDHIPYLSDFDAIRKINTTDELLTFKFDHIRYMSPEQYRGPSYSFPTDIFPFGLIIYYLFEKEDCLKTINDSNYVHQIENIRLPENCKMPKSIQDIFKRCVSFEAKDRPSIDDVINYLYDDANSFYFLQIPILKNVINDIDKQVVVHYFKEIYYLLFVYKKLEDEYFTAHEIQLYQILNFIYYKADISNIFYKIGKIYYDGEIAEQDFQKAKEYFELAIKHNHSSAMCDLGSIYEYGLGVDPDVFKAIEYYEEAIKQKNPQAFFRMAGLYEDGYGVEKNVVKAIEYYKIAAEHKVSAALVCLGYFYQIGSIVEQDYNQSKQYYELVDKNKYPIAYTNLAFLYQFGKGVDQDYKKAKELYERAADLNEPNAFNNLGKMYFYGYGVDRNYEKAKKYFELAKEQNFTISIYNLGIMYKKGLGCVKDYSRAKSYFEESNDLYESIYQIGKLYLHGFGVDKDLNKAKYYFEKAAKGDYAKSFYQLGMLFMNGLGVEQNYDKAAIYFEKAGLLSYHKAKFQIGILNFYGLIQNHSYLKAREYFEISSERCFNSLFYLGLIFEEGLGIKRDISKSIDYFDRCSKSKFFDYVNPPSQNPAELNYQVLKNDALPYEISIFKNYFYYHANNELGLIHLFQSEYEKAFELIKEAGLNEYPFGQNNLGLYHQFFLNDPNRALQYYTKASEQSKFALSEFNHGFICEENGDINESIEHYKKASEYENEMTTLKNHKFEDERLEKSKSFIICYTNLKLSLFYSSQGQAQLDEILPDDFILKAIFRPLFCLLMHSKSYSYIFNFSTIETEKGVIITNLRDFIFNNPLFQFQDELSDSKTFGWKTVIPKSNEELELTLSFIQKNQPDEQYEILKGKYLFEQEDELLLPQIDEANSNLKIEKIFEYMNKQNKFNLIAHEFNHSEKIETLKIKMNGNNFLRYFKYPKKICDIILNSFKNNPKEIIEVVEEMKKIIFIKPYCALFGRIGFDKIKEKRFFNINNEFYEGMSEK